MPVFNIVIPVLREAGSLHQSISHFEALAEGHAAQIIVVTSARERAEAFRYPEAGDSIAVAEHLAREGKSVHLHYPDPEAIKADQLNFAIEHCLGCLHADAALNREFLLIYDADSRPPLNSLTHFEHAIALNPEASVFHQSSRFELRAAGLDSRNVLTRLWRTLSDSGTLRANRFVLGFEIPRLLNRSNFTGTVKRWLSSYIYAHVTGHGLCVRLSLLRELPFPSRSPLEDMHFSFILGSRNLAVVPIPSLDSADVPNSVIVQFEQLVRWFFGPARFLRYLADPATRPGWRARLLAASAAGITLGWLSCAIVPALLTVLLWSGDWVMRSLLGVFIVAYTAQLILVDQFMASGASQTARIARVLMSPFTCTLFGVAGLVGIGKLIFGKGPSTGKTEDG